MKKIILFLFCIMALYSFSNGQITVGVLAGKSGIIGGESWKDPLGLQVSVETRFIELNENSSVSAGLGVSFQGAAYEEHEFSGKVALSYLNLPVIYTFSSNSGFYIEAGLQPGLLISAKDKFDDMSYDYKDYVKSFELGVPVGAGYQITDCLSAGIRAVFGLTNLDNSGSDVSDHNYLIGALLRYNIDLNKIK